MKYYLFCLSLILLCVTAVVLASDVLLLTQNFLVQAQIPQNNSAILGLQKKIIPPYSKGLPIPDLTAKAVLVKDLTTDTILYQKEIHTKLPIASTTKVITALVASEYFKSNSILTVKDGIKVDGAKVGFFEGESLTFRSVLYGMLLNSGNDAAYVIAEDYPGGVLGFISAMNKKAKSLGLKDTHFENPAGFDNPNHYSSAYDLGILTQEALRVSELSKIFATKETQIVSMDKKYTHSLQNLNKLLSTLTGVIGVKTGYTQAAKENLITLVDRGGHRILTVVLGSDDRFGETTNLVEWVYQNYSWTN